MLTLGQLSTGSDVVTGSVVDRVWDSEVVTGSVVDRV